MHPIDQADRRRYLKEVGGVGYCNITKCCTEVCPEHIKITDNAIIPLKERVADEFYDPIQWVWRKLRGAPDTPTRAELPVLPAAPGSTRGGATAHGDADSATPMHAPEGSMPPAPRRAATRPKRPRRRSDAADETPSEG
jgi:hypothetical protein